MPRLEGKRSNVGIYILLFVFLALAILVLLEYSGTIDLIREFGA